MSYFLNFDNELFNQYKRSRIFVDKSMIINITNKSLNKESFKYMCVTRPRRFGKTMALSMLNAYYSKGCDSKEIFDKLNISKDGSYLNHLNKYNVIWIDMAGIYTSIRNKNHFIKELETTLLDDLNEAFPNTLEKRDNTIGNAILKINSKLKERFIFLIDGWDVLIREQQDNYDLINDYMMLLRSLFKSSDVSRCFDLVYVTGILPIRHGTS